MKVPTAIQSQNQMTTTPPIRGGVLQRKCACGQHTVAGGECTECREKQVGAFLVGARSLQRRAANQVEPTTVPPVVHEVLRSPGQPLDPATRASMEPRFGHDFSQVRVHRDATAGESAQAVNALAYTVGRDIVFGAGQYTPGTANGRHLLAHELTHVIQQRSNTPLGQLRLDARENGTAESKAERAAQAIENSEAKIESKTLSSQVSAPSIQRRVRPENVTCREHGLTSPDLTGAEVIAALQAADAEAITLALRAERLLEFHQFHLLFAEIGEPVDAAFDTILQEELGLTLTNPAHHPLIEQQINRFRRVRELLESGFLRYMCRGGTVSLVGCTPGTCGVGGLDYAFSCEANRLIVLCQDYWDEPEERPGTLLHEPFHVLFSMARHATNALRRADASCFEAFARRVAGEAPPFSCSGHTAG